MRSRRSRIYHACVAGATRSCFTPCVLGTFVLQYPQVRGASSPGGRRMGNRLAYGATCRYPGATRIFARGSARLPSFRVGRSRRALSRRSGVRALGGRVVSAAISRVIANLSDLLAYAITPVIQPTQPWPGMTPSAIRTDPQNARTARPICETRIPDPLRFRYTCNVASPR